MGFRKLTDFIQSDVIVGMLRDKLEASMVVRNVVNVTTNSSLGKGSSYKIPGVGNLTVNAYDGTGVTPEAASMDAATIFMDQYPFINFYLEDSDVNEVSALSLAGAWAGEAGMRIAQTIDVDVLSAIDANAQAGTGIGEADSGIVLDTSAKILNYVEDFATQLKEANVETDAVIVLPSFMGVALSRELGVNVNNQNVAGQIELGFVQKLFGLEVYTSNNLPAGVASGLASDEYSVIGGKRSAFHLIEGLTVVKNGDSETKPATWNQYGQVYGRGYSQENAWLKGVVSKS